MSGQTTETRESKVARNTMLIGCIHSGVDILMLDLVSCRGLYLDTKLHNHLVAMLSSESSGDKHCFANAFPSTINQFRVLSAVLMKFVFCARAKPLNLPQTWEPKKVSNFENCGWVRFRKTNYKRFFT